MTLPWTILPMLGLLIGLTASSAGAADFDPSQVFTQIQRIEWEVLLLYAHGNRKPEMIAPVPVKAELRPRHVWQKTYLILIKLNILRAKHGLPRILPNGLEPVLKLDPALVLEQTQRILTELTILKGRLGITRSIEEPPAARGKRPIDNYNQLHAISLHLDALIGEDIDPSHVFGESMRLFEDASTLLDRLHLPDTAFPPARLADATSHDAQAAAMAVLGEIQRIQADLGLQRTDFSPFLAIPNPRPADIFNLVGLALADLQTVKAALGVEQITPPHRMTRGKTQAHVQQLLGWVARKLSLIQTLRQGGAP
ncbi:MAG: hypothetical protein HQL82_11455 [Magnetococcales bacterium]|nr:hypothetical protein [Magnetococcales bacterium]